MHIISSVEYKGEKEKQHGRPAREQKDKPGATAVEMMELDSVKFMKMTRDGRTPTTSQ